MKAMAGLGGRWSAKCLQFAGMGGRRATLDSAMCLPDEEHTLLPAERPGSFCCGSCGRRPCPPAEVCHRGRIVLPFQAEGGVARVELVDGVGWRVPHARSMFCIGMLEGLSLTLFQACLPIDPGPQFPPEHSTSQAAQTAVDGLRGKVHETQQSLSREQDMAQRLKRESASAASAAQRQVR